MEGGGRRETDDFMAKRVILVIDIMSRGEMRYTAAFTAACFQFFKKTLTNTFLLIYHARFRKL